MLASCLQVAQSTAPPCPKTGKFFNCKVCTDSAECAECNAGFFVSAGECLACERGCAICNHRIVPITLHNYPPLYRENRAAGAICSECREGWFAVDADNTENAVKCKECEKECRRCQGGPGICTECGDEYYLDEAKYTCEFKYKFHIIFGSVVFGSFFIILTICCLQLLCTTEDEESYKNQESSIYKGSILDLDEDLKKDIFKSTIDGIGANNTSYISEVKEEEEFSYSKNSLASWQKKLNKDLGTPSSSNNVPEISFDEKVGKQ